MDPGKYSSHILCHVLVVNKNIYNLKLSFTAYVFMILRAYLPNEVKPEFQFDHFLSCVCGVADSCGPPFSTYFLYQPLKYHDKYNEVCVQRITLFNTQLLMSNFPLIEQKIKHQNLLKDYLYSQSRHSL